MKAKIVAGVVLLGGLATTACDSIGQAMTAHTDVVARAAKHELKVDKAAAFIAVNPRIPASPDVVTAVANLWVDYTLLATAASRDSTLRNVSLDELLRPMLQSEMVMKLREQVIKVNTDLSEDDLRKRFSANTPGAKVKARHILLTMPPDATPQVRDSVNKLAGQLLERLIGGEDFATLAKQYSKDGSAAQGGDLGYFEHHEMVAPFADAAFKLNPGQISGLVESQFGIHIIKVEDKQVPSYDTQTAEQKAAYRATALKEDTAKAEESYIKALVDSAKLEVQEGAYDVVRDLAPKPEGELKGRAASRALVKYRGGEFTARDFVEVLRGVQPQNRGQIQQMPDEQMKVMLEQMTRTKLLVDAAEERKLAMPAPRLDSIKTQTYAQLVEATRAAGLLNIQPQEGESKDDAILRRVNTLIEGTIKGEQNVIPLGALSFALREQFGGEIFERAIPAVVAKVDATRPPAAPNQPGMPIQPPPTGTSPQPGAPPGR